MATLGNPKETIEILNKYGFNFQKKFGQNFLIDTHVLEKIIRAAEITREDCVLEIGPGIGTMTQYLCENAGKVIAVEIDKNLMPILTEDTLAAYDNVKVINADVLKLDLKKLEDEEKKKERDRRLTIKYKQDAKLAEDLKLSDEEFLDMILTALYNSKANTVIIQLQDILWLGSEARMNTPSTLGDNWKWRASREYLTDEIAERLMNYAKNSNRI